MRLIALLALVVTVLDAQEVTRPTILRGVGFDQKLDEQVPLDLEFRDEAGRRVRLAQYFGRRPVVLSLVYYECPMLCTLVLNGMLRAFRTLSFDIGGQFEVLTVSIDPRETPELAARKKQVYMDGYGRPGAERGWRFLTGNQASIEALARAVGFRYAYDPASGQFAHASGIAVLTPQGRIARYQYGVEYSARDLRLALIEASQNKIGTPVDQVLLYCFAYNPATGTYGAAIMNLLRAGALATLLVLGGLVLVLLRRDRRAKPRVA